MKPLMYAQASGTGRDTFMHNIQQPDEYRYANLRIPSLLKPFKFDKCSRQLTKLVSKLKTRGKSCGDESVPRRQADGTGRDAYIYYNNGGFEVPQLRYVAVILTF